MKIKIKYEDCDVLKKEAKLLDEYSKTTFEFDLIHNVKIENDNTLTFKIDDDLFYDACVSIKNASNELTYLSNEIGKMKLSNLFKKWNT